MSRTTKSHNGCVLFCLFSSTFLITGEAWALNFTWNSQTGGSFQSATNWTPPFVGPPDDASDTAIFALGGTFTTSFAGDVTNGQLAIRATSGIVTLDLDGHTYTLSGPAAGSLFVGQAVGNIANLVLTDGTLAADDSIIVGDVVGSQGFFNVIAGGTLSQTSGTLRVGANGTGSMQVVQGGITNTGSVLVGDSPSGVGSLNVSGVNSLLQQNGANTTLMIGSATGGQGQLVIQNSGHYQTGTGLTTVNPTGQILMPLGVASRLFINGDLRVDGGSIVRAGCHHRSSGSPPTRKCHR